MRVLLVNDTSHMLNWGCRATCSQLKRLIAGSGHELSGSIRVTQLAHPLRQFRREWIRRLDSSRIVRRLTRRHKPARLWDWLLRPADIVPERFEDFATFARRVSQGEVSLRSSGLSQDTDIVETRLDEALESCDVVLVNGEGSLHGNRRIVRAILALVHVAKTQYGKPCIITNHSLAVQDGPAKPMVEAVYPLLDDVSFREPISVRLAAPYVAERQRPLLVPDAAFLLGLDGPDGRTDAQSALPSAIDASSPYIVVTGSSGLRSVKAAVTTYRRLCTRLGRLGAPIVLAAHCSFEEKLFGVLGPQLARPVVPLAAPLETIAGVLSRASVVIGGRWHAGILALEGGTPLVPFTANTHKMDGLVELFELETPCLDVTALDREVDAVVERTGSLLEAGDSLRKRLRDRAAELGAQAGGHVRWLEQENLSEAKS